MAQEALTMPADGSPLAERERLRLGWLASAKAKVRAEFGNLVLETSEIAGLQEGDVILPDEFTARQGDDGLFTGEVILRVGRGRAFGLVGNIVGDGQTLAVEITDVIQGGERG
jgi:hypothetical protein